MEENVFGLMLWAKHGTEIEKLAKFSTLSRSSNRYWDIHIKCLLGQEIFRVDLAPLKNLMKKMK